MPRKKKVESSIVTDKDGKSIEDIDVSVLKGKRVSFDANDITNKIIEFGKLLTGVELYSYQLESAYAIIYSVITFSGDVKTMLFSRQSGKSEVMAFIIDTLTVLLPALARVIPDLEQFKSGFRIGLFAPQADQVTTTYSRALSRINSANAEMVMSDPDLGITRNSDVKLILSNGSFLMGQVASKKSKIESKTYDLVIVEEAQDVDDLLVNKSIEPMVSATSGSIIKVGTTGMTKNHFWYEIQHNRNEDRKLKDKRLRKHFEYNYKDIIKARRAQYEIDHKMYHLNYENDINRKLQRWGRDSQQFRLAYALEWDLESGMLLTDEEFASMLNKRLGFQEPGINDRVVAGIDIGKHPASTIITIGKVTEDPDDYEGKPFKQILGWIDLGGLDYEAQHNIILDAILEFNISKIYMDYTGVGRPVVDRLIAACGDYTYIEPYTFTAQSKSDMWYNLLGAISTHKLIVPANQSVRESAEFSKFEEQLKNCTKGFNGPYLVCQKSEGYFDDYCDSLALFCMAADSGFETENVAEIEVDENPMYRGIHETINAIRKNSY